MQQPQQQGNENSLDFLWTVALVVVAILAIWYFGKDYIVAVLFQIKTWEIVGVKAILSLWNGFITFLYLPGVDLSPLNQALGIISKSSTDVDFKTVTEVSAAVGKFSRYPFMLILLALAAYLYFASVSLKFKNIFTMQRLKETEKVNWPRIMPVVNLKLVDADIDKGPWAMSVNPMFFCKKYKLIKEEVKEGKPAVSLLRGKASKVLALQLGPLWRGRVDVLPKHIQALFAVFAARVDGNVAGADELLDQIAGSGAGGSNNLDFSGVNALLRKHINNKAVGKVASRHAYVTTMMASMLELARTAGVAASADFVWLKPKDRKLWYVLNSIGRQTAVSEVAGIFSHWQVERSLQYPLKTPMVDAAVNGLEEALQEVIYEPEDDE
ncbi:MAG: type IVB secretion system coupling complex protein DotM/IcmP [Gammaproteobacteria bacterium]|nr:type IVB secretion system coupling complex protein DotM/IcmP [Gammaproteobacteria bacterium]